MVTQVADDLWIFDQGANFFGLELHRILSIIRLKDSTLAIHAPFYVASEVIEEIQSLGVVSAIIAPSSFAQRCAVDWLTIFPGAKLFYSLDISGKTPEDLQYVSNKIALNQEAFALLEPNLEALPVLGMPYLNECLFYHRASQSLLVSSLFSFTPKAQGILAKFMSWLLGITRGQLSYSRMIRWCIRDQGQFLQSLAKMKLWTVSRYILSQSAMIERSKQVDMKLLKL